MRHLKEQFETEAQEMDSGIYQLTGLPFPVQLVLIPRLSREEYVWMSRLRCDLTVKEDIEPLANAYRNHDHSPLYQSVMDLIVRANKKKYEEAREMCDALMELFEDKLKEKERSGWLEGRQEGRQEGHREGRLDSLVKKARKKYEKGLDTAEAAECLEETVEVIETVYELIRQNPQIDDAEICMVLKEND